MAYSNLWKEKTVSQEFYIQQNYPLKMKMKLIHSQKFSEKICDKQMCPIKNTKGSLSGIKEMTPDANSNWREEMKSNGKGKFVSKYKRQCKYILLLFFS